MSLMVRLEIANGLGAHTADVGWDIIAVHIKVSP